MPKRVPFYPLRPSIVPTHVPKREPIAAKYKGFCFMCRSDIDIGNLIVEHHRLGWVHARCVDASESEATANVPAYWLRKPKPRAGSDANA
jgi:hypothetical protein